MVLEELRFIRWRELGLVCLLVDCASERRLRTQVFLIHIFRLAVVTIIALTGVPLQITNSPYLHCSSVLDSRAARNTVRNSRSEPSLRRAESSAEAFPSTFQMGPFLN